MLEEDAAEESLNVPEEEEAGGTGANVDVGEYVPVPKVAVGNNDEDSEVLLGEGGG